MPGAHRADGRQARSGYRHLSFSRPRRARRVRPRCPHRWSRRSHPPSSRSPAAHEAGWPWPRGPGVRHHRDGRPASRSRDTERTMLTTSTAPPPSAERRPTRPPARRPDLLRPLPRGGRPHPRRPGGRRACSCSSRRSRPSWHPPRTCRTAESLSAYIAPLVFGTLLSSIIALIIGTPLGVAVALFITHYAPRRLAQGLSYVVDLLAAVPAIVFGLWGAITLAPASLRSRTGSTSTSAWLPFFAGPVSATGRTMLVVGIDAGGHDPADHHRGLARGVPADAQAARGGGARAGRHALGDDPDGGAAVRPLRHHQRRDARARPRARRDDGRRDHPLGVAASSRST